MMVYISPHFKKNASYGYWPVVEEATEDFLKRILSDFLVEYRQRRA